LIEHVVDPQAALLLEESVVLQLQQADWALAQLHVELRDLGLEVDFGLAGFIVLAGRVEVNEGDDAKAGEVFEGADVVLRVLVRDQLLDLNQVADREQLSVWQGLCSDLHTLAQPRYFDHEFLRDRFELTMHVHFDLLAMRLHDFGHRLSLLGTQLQILLNHPQQQDLAHVVVLQLFVDYCFQLVSGQRVVWLRVCCLDGRGLAGVAGWLLCALHF
jgi:hypothetical protein